MSLCDFITSSEKVAWVRTLLIFVTIIVGWGVSMVIANRTARRSETRNILDKAIDLVQKIESEFLSLYNKTDLDPQMREIASKSLFATFQSLASYIDLLERRGMKLENSTELMVDFLHNVTIDIENPKRDSISERSKEVSRLSRTIRVNLEKIFLKNFSENKKKRS